jgi:hypothetical protein
MLHIYRIQSDEPIIHIYHNIPTCWLKGKEVDSVRRGAYPLDPRKPHEGHYFDVNLCLAFENLFKGKEVLDLGAGIGQYGRCFLRMKEPMFPLAPAADQVFLE